MCYPILRSQRNSFRSDRLRFLLSLTVLGAGMTGGARVGFAQDTVAPNAATSQAPSTTALPSAAPDPLQNDPGKSQDGKNLTDKDKAALRKQMDALVQQRTEMDRHIAALRRQLGERGVYYRFNSNGVNGMSRSYSNIPLFIAPQPGRKLTDEEKRAVQEATRQAQSSAREAMRQAQEAMRQAQRAMEEANRAMQRSGGNGSFVMPALPPLPKLNFNFDDRFDFNGTNFDFQFDHLDFGNNTGWKQWQEKMQTEFGTKFQQQFEKQMRQFEEKRKDRQRQLRQAPPSSLKEDLEDLHDTLKDNLKDKENETDQEDTLDLLDRDAPADAHSPI